MQDHSHYNFDQMMQNINMEVGRDSRREDEEEGSESHFSLPDVSRGPDNWDN